MGLPRPAKRWLRRRWAARGLARSYRETGSDRRPRHIQCGQRPAQGKDKSEMDLMGKLRNGLRIVGSDGREYGTIDRYDDQYAYVGERRIPISAFERMDRDRLYVGTEGMQYFDTAGHAINRGDI